LARKKIVLFIVEGPSDLASLELLLTKVIEGDNQVHFEIVGGDITTDFTVNSSNIKSKIVDIVKAGGKRKYKPSDYKEVIHLVDMDGAYLDEKNICIDELLNRFSYKDDKIFANNIEHVLTRNSKKQKILNILCSTNKAFKSVPYRVFYFSANLEHVLHNKIDIEDKEKMKYAEKFEDKYIDDLESFINYFCESTFAVKKNYKDSWKFIKENNNSIKRFSNLNIVLDEYKIL